MYIQCYTCSSCYYPFAYTRKQFKSSGGFQLHLPLMPTQVISLNSHGLALTTSTKSQVLNVVWTQTRT